MLRAIPFKGMWNISGYIHVSYDKTNQKFVIDTSNGYYDTNNFDAHYNNTSISIHTYEYSGNNNVYFVFNKTTKLFRFVSYAVDMSTAIDYINGNDLIILYIYKTFGNLIVPFPGINVKTTNCDVIKDSSYLDIIKNNLFLNSPILNLYYNYDPSNPINCLIPFNGYNYNLNNDKYDKVYNILFRLGGLTNTAPFVAYTTGNYDLRLISFIPRTGYDYKIDLVALDNDIEYLLRLSKYEYNEHGEYEGGYTHQFSSNYLNPNSQPGNKISYQLEANSDYFIMACRQNDAPFTDDILMKYLKNIVICVVKDEYPYGSDNIVDYMNENGFYNYGTGEFVTHEQMKCKGFIPCKGINTLYANNFYIQMCFYDRSKKFIGSSSNHGSYQHYYYGECTIKKVPIIKIDVPANAYYMSFSTRKQCTGTSTRQYIGTDLNKCFSNYICDLSKFDSSTDSINKYGYYAISSNTLSITNNGVILGEGDWISESSNLVSLLYSESCLEFKLNSHSDILFAISSTKGQVVSNSVNDADFCVRIDSSNKTIRIYRCNIGGNLYTEITNLCIGQTTFNYNLTNGEYYYIKIHKNSIYNYVVELGSLDHYSEPTVLELTSVAGSGEGGSSADGKQVRGWGTPALMCNSGEIEVKRIYMTSTKDPDCKVAILGDSYIENMSRARSASWAYLFYDLRDGDCIMSGSGGATANDLLKRIAGELQCIKSKYIILAVGINDSNSSVATATYIEQMIELIGYVTINGAEPILMTTPYINDASNKTLADEYNAWIRASGYRYLDIYRALTNPDGTQNTNLYRSDKVHPNLDGAKNIINILKQDLPDLLV